MADGGSLNDGEPALPGQADGVTIALNDLAPRDATNMTTPIEGMRHRSASRATVDVALPPVEEDARAVLDGLEAIHNIDSDSTMAAWDQWEKEAAANIHRKWYYLPETRDAETAALPLKERIFVTMSVPTASKWAFAYFIYILILILMSTITFCVQTIPPPDDELLQWESMWYVFELVYVINFTGDYVIRLATAPRKVKFMLNPYNIIDFLTIIPFYIQVILLSSHVNAVAALAAVRILRTIRILRVVRVGGASPTVMMIGHAFVRARDGIILLIGLLAIALIFLSACVFFAEGSESQLRNGVYYYVSGPNAGEASCFQNVFGSMWWTLVTMTTVGYGDCVPVTPAGKVVGAFTMICGVLVIAFPITVLNANLNEVYAEFKERRRIKRAQRNKSFGLQDINALVAMLSVRADRQDDIDAPHMKRLAVLADKLKMMNELNHEIDTLISGLAIEEARLGMAHPPSLGSSRGSPSEPPLDTASVGGSSVKQRARPVSQGSRPVSQGSPPVSLASS